MPSMQTNVPISPYELTNTGRLTVGCSAELFGLSPGATADVNSAAIASAIIAGRGSVTIGPGIYRVNPMIWSPQILYRENPSYPTHGGLHVRGAGPLSTILDFSGVPDDDISIGFSPINVALLLSSTSGSGRTCTAASASSSDGTWAGFTSADVGKVIYSNDCGSTYATITAFTSATQVTVTIGSNNAYQKNIPAGHWWYSGNLTLSAATVGTGRTFTSDGKFWPGDGSAVGKFISYGDGIAQITVDSDAAGLVVTATIIVAFTTTSVPVGQWAYGYGNPAIRVESPPYLTKIVRTHILSPIIEGMTIRRAKTWGGECPRTGRAIAFESSEKGTITTRVTAGAILKDVNFDGWSVAFHADDCTGMTVHGCDFRNNTWPIWQGYNADIWNFKACMFGDEASPVGLPKPTIVSLSKIGGAGGSNTLFFDSCWFMACNQVLESLSGGGPFQFRNCYMEQIRAIAFLSSNGPFLMDGCVMTSFVDSDMDLLPAINITSSGKPRVTIRSCAGGNINGTSGPRNAWVNLPGWGGEAGFGNLIWENNTIGYSSSNSGGHFRVDTNDLGSLNVILYDGLASSDTAMAGNRYYFEGAIQTDGTERIVSVSTGSTLQPQFWNGMTYYMNNITSNVTVNAMSTWASRVGSYGAALRHIPLRFILKEGANASSGAHTITFATSYAFNSSFVQSTTNDALKITIVSMRWDGNFFREISPTNKWA